MFSSLLWKYETACGDQLKHSICFFYEKLVFLQLHLNPQERTDFME